MPDRYNNFLQLQQRAQGLFRIQARFRSEKWLIMAIHGGGIEMGTSELAQAIAGSDYSIYLFEGFAPNNQILHITSTNFDEPDCLELVKKHHSALSLHGFMGSQSDPQIYLGGKDWPMMEGMLEILCSNGYQAQINTGKYAAADPLNICNRTRTGKGLQMELSGQLRNSFFEDYQHRKGRETHTDEFFRFINVVRFALGTC